MKYFTIKNFYFNKNVYLYECYMYAGGGVRYLSENGVCKHLPWQIAILEKVYFNAKKSNSTCIYSWSKKATHVVQSHLGNEKELWSLHCLPILFVYCIFFCLVNKAEKPRVLSQYWACTEKIAMRVRRQICILILLQLTVI